MVVNDNACLLTQRGVYKSIASKLAPTEEAVVHLTDGQVMPFSYPLYCVTQRVVVVTRVTSPSALTSPMTSVLSRVWQVRSGGGGGAAGGGGGGLAQALRIMAQSTSDVGAKTRFPRLFIG